MTGSAQAITLVELKLDQCSQWNPTNGPTPAGLTNCNATSPCPNTWAHCQDKCSFECQLNSYWYTDCRMPVHLMSALKAYIHTPEAIQSIDHLPTLFCPGEFISQRGVIRICLYAAKRCNDLLGGSDLSRLLQAQKFIEGRTISVYYGNCDMNDICQFSRTDWIIDKVDGPSGRECIVCFTCKDPLTLADGATCPRSEDKIAADANNSNSRTAPFTLGLPLDGFPDDNSPLADPYSAVNNYLLPVNYSDNYSDAQNRCMARANYVQIGQEIIKVNPEKNTGLVQGWNFKLANRAQCKSTLEPHNIGDAITLCESFENEHVVDVWLRLLTECADLAETPIDCCTDENRSLINYESFERVRCENPLFIIQETIICEPTSTQKLREELASQFLLMEAYDQTTGQINLLSYKPPEQNSVVNIITERNMVEDSFKISKGVEPYNRIIFAHDLVDCSKGISDGNFNSIKGYVSDDLKNEVCARREYKNYRDKNFKSRWLNGSSGYLAETLSYRHYLIHQCPLRDICFETTVDFAKELEFGEFYLIRHDKLSQWDGTPIDAPFMLKGKQNIKNNCVKVTFQESSFSNIVACLNCDTDNMSTFEPAVDPCISDCKRIW